MTEVNQTLIKLTPEMKLVIQTFVSFFCSVVGSWILFGQWWIEIWAYICYAKGWPIKNYSLAPGGGILLATGIYCIPIPHNNYEWIGQLTSVIQPYWWIPLVIDPFHIMAVGCITIIAIRYIFQFHKKQAHHAAQAEAPNNNHETENTQD